MVYKARHGGLHRLSALKLVLAGEFASPAQELRFRLEAELAARVQHPNIVQVSGLRDWQLVFSPDGATLASGFADFTVRL
jgi:hypothetical protein